MIQSVIVGPPSLTQCIPPAERAELPVITQLVIVGLLYQTQETPPPLDRAVFPVI